MTLCKSSDDSLHVSSYIAESLDDSLHVRDELVTLSVLLPSFLADLFVPKIKLRERVCMYVRTYACMHITSFRRAAVSSQTIYTLMILICWLIFSDHGPKDVTKVCVCVLCMYVCMCKYTLFTYSIVICE